MPNASVPVDPKRMRETATLLLAPDAREPAPDELDSLLLALRGMIENAVPEIEAVAARLPEDDVPRACALACIGEARMRLRLTPGEAFDQRHIVAQKLALTVRSLADHYWALGRAS
ncbi:DUF6415 family natural product biosynthesis protein [Streptomyces sp. NPDC057245]|uniref:DUF6415 family natural product biosynthesis protein n=1 Tax=Streptomyces TaxID=1883 RepID=UPI001C1E0081|nr:DUF6415 family natural product biosynthesis protein [Streptomyces sp. A108]MBU6529815.1 hypothetical protein [Streptomyces sp. A108]